jgi:hypothetical protein
MNSTKQPTKVLDIPETLALKIRAPARTAIQIPRYQCRRRPSSATRPMAKTRPRAKATAAMFG